MKSTFSPAGRGIIVEPIGEMNKPIADTIALTVFRARLTALS
jgi:hypothetical protein